MPEAYNTTPMKPFAEWLYARGDIGIGSLIDAMYWDALARMKIACIEAMQRFEDTIYRHDLEWYYGRPLTDSEVDASKRGIDLGFRRAE